MTEKNRQTKGCRETRDQTLHRIGQELSFKTCIGNFVNQKILRFFEAFLAFEAHGVLPFPGSYLEQPAKIMDMFDHFRSYQHERSIEEQKKLKKKEKARSNGR
jgi:hypothetical protein